MTVGQVVVLVCLSHEGGSLPFKVTLSICAVPRRNNKLFRGVKGRKEADQNPDK